MATIFNFKPVPAQQDKPARRQVACEVILFPGVRYERWENTPPQPVTSYPLVGKPVAKTRAKKRKLEMAD